MVTYILEASSTLRFVDQEAGAGRVLQILTMAVNGQCDVQLSAVNWGEVVYILSGRKMAASDLQFYLSVLESTIEVVPASADRAARAGLIKARFAIPYADCFCVELASDSAEHVLVTADFDLKPAEQDISIEFLPPKPKP